MEDKRFTHVSTDPKFRRIPKGAKKVKIDKRFQSMFKNKNFKIKYTVDKRGRPVSHNSNEDLKRYYALSSEESEAEDNEPGTSEKVLEQKEDTDKPVSEKIKAKLKNLKVNYARGEGTLLSESSSDEESGEEVEEAEDHIEHNWGELDNDAGKRETATSRLAACNMDWDRIRAIDLMVLFSSFLPAGGVITSVAIYPSEFGKQRMKEEEIKGPSELVENSHISEDEDGEEGSKYHMEKLRQYQLNRLKYYYAVITTDSASTADKIYTECDGMEYESTATKIDLRFIPEDMTFDDEPKEESSKIPEAGKYAPRFFTTTALQQAKVDLTWDETDLERVEVSQKLKSGKIDEISRGELDNYVALSDEEDEEEIQLESDIKNPLEKYKQLLQEITDKEEEKKNKDVEMEVSWGIDLKQKTEALVKDRSENDKDKTPFQKYLDKRQEKRKERKKKKKAVDEDEDDFPSDIDLNDPYFAEEFDNPEFKKPKAKKTTEEKEEQEESNDLELLLMDEEDGKAHFSLKKIQQQEESKTKKKSKKRKLEETTPDDFEVDVNDSRFSALYTSHLYNIDPSDPHYKKTRNMETLIKEKLKRRGNDEEKKPSDGKKAELNLLVKSVKRKAEEAFKRKN